MRSRCEAEKVRPVSNSEFEMNVQPRPLSLYLSPPMEPASPEILHAKGRSLSDIFKSTVKSSKLTSINIADWAETIFAHVAMP
jgi:hypothetical protein